MAKNLAKQFIVDEAIESSVVSDSGSDSDDEPMQLVKPAGKKRPQKSPKPGTSSGSTSKAKKSKTDGSPSSQFIFNKKSEPDEDLILVGKSNTSGMAATNAGKFVFFNFYWDSKAKEYVPSKTRVRWEKSDIPLIRNALEKYEKYFKRNKI